MANVVREILDEEWREIGGVDGAKKLLKQLAEERGVATNSDIEGYDSPTVLGDDIPTPGFNTRQWRVGNESTMPPVLRREKEGDECLN